MKFHGSYSKKFPIFATLIAFRSIGITWCLILITGVPVMMSHGETVYMDYYNETQAVKCVFLSEAGYSLVAFQVRIEHASFKIHIN